MRPPPEIHLGKPPTVANATVRDVQFGSYAHDDGHHAADGTCNMIAIFEEVAFGARMPARRVERERDLALSEQARRAVEEIDHAIAKFELGTYGICEVSGEPIPEARLEAMPATRTRVEFA